MLEKETIERAREDAREGKAPSTQAGEFVREEIHHVREGKHGVRNPKQAIAIGLSKARKAGVKLPPAPKGTASAEKEGGGRRSRRSRPSRSRPSKTRSRATTRALKREGQSGASHRALSSQARSSARRRTRSSRSQAAPKAARTRTSSPSHRARR
jgi:Family of unknown function (DUF6496)